MTDNMRILLLLNENMSMTDNSAKDSLTYRDAGVDIDAGNRLVDKIKPLAKSTHREGVLGSIGGFGGLFDLPVAKYKEPVLVSGTDGVGTKLKLAIDMDKHDTIGIDLVAMCVNDIIVTGAEPLFFLDYFATSKLDVEAATEIISGIAEGCRQSGAALNGGETAEMPGLYASGDYDLAGFAVGVVEKSKIIDPEQVSKGDVVLGLESSGTHSNGYSLIRKVIDVSGANLSDPFDGRTLGEALLAPTKIYVKPILEILENAEVHAIAHITGGGITENIPRAIPDGLGVSIDLNAWQRPQVFDWLATEGNINEDEMLLTFNCGIGMTLIVPEKSVASIQAILNNHDINSFIVGEVVEDQSNSVQYKK